MRQATDDWFSCSVSESIEFVKVLAGNTVRYLATCINKEYIRNTRVQVLRVANSLATSEQGPLCTPFHMNLVELSVCSPISDH